MTAVRHTFLFEPCTWSANGTFMDAEGGARAVEGSADIAHGPGAWTNRSVMRLVGPSPAEFVNDYTIVPFAPGAPATAWESQNASLGRMSGRFALLGHTILSTFAAADGLHTGAESLQMIEPRRYLGRGVLYRGGEFLSGWLVELRRAASA